MRLEAQRTDEQGVGAAVEGGEKRTQRADGRMAGAHIAGPPERQQRFALKQRLTDVVERGHAHPIELNIDRQRRARQQRGLQRVQPGDAGVAAEVNAGSVAQCVERRLDLGTAGRAALHGAAQHRTKPAYSTLAPLRLMMGFITASSFCMNFDRSAGDPPAGSM